MNNECIEIEIKRFIDDEKEYDSVKNNQNGVLDYLNSLTDDDISKIADEILNDEWFTNEMNSVINDYLYHYKKWFKEENNNE